jgi:diadenosine tetraphosphate (Ap4A) HIT family hydrolase
MEKILYTSFLKEERGKGCPFCAPHRLNEIIAENKHAYLTYALAPYSSYHLLVVPKRHVEYIRDLTAKERDAIENLIESADKILRQKNIENYFIIVRNGKRSHKSVLHLHYNVIPSHRERDFNVLLEKRRILSDREINKLLKETRNILK